MRKGVGKNIDTDEKELDAMMRAAHEVFAELASAGCDFDEPILALSEEEKDQCRANFGETLKTLGLVEPTKSDD